MRNPAEGPAYPLLIREMISSHSCRRSDAEIVDAGGRRFTYPEFIARVGRVAATLTGIGATKDDVVAVMDWDSHRYLECYFAVPMLGATLQMVNIRLSAEQIAYTLNHAGARVLIVHEDFFGILAEIAPQLISIELIVTIGAGDLLGPGRARVAGDYYELSRSASPMVEFPTFDENRRATLFYTSGTTGLPKGVFFSHRQIVLQTMAVLATFGTRPSQGRLAADDVYMPITPMFHAHAWSFPFAMTMMGAKQVYPGRYQVEVLARMFKEEGVTFTHCVATLLQMLLDMPGSDALDLKGVKMIIGGGALPAGLAQRALARGIDVFTGYGMSETGPVQTINHLSRDEEARGIDEQPALRMRAGRPIMMCDLRVVGPDLEPVADGNEGEVVFRSPWLTLGYLDNPEASTALWEGGRLHSGDIGRFDEKGVLHITDRMKDVIKTGGEWVSSLDLESLISQAEGVSEVAVIGVHDDKWGERPMALVVPLADQAVDAAGIRATLFEHAAAGRIPRYAVPDRILFVEALARTSVGKLDKKALRQMYAA